MQIRALETKIHSLLATYVGTNSRLVISITSSNNQTS